MYKILQSKDFLLLICTKYYSYVMPVIYLYSHTAKYNGREKTNNIIIAYNKTICKIYIG